MAEVITSRSNARVKLLRAAFQEHRRTPADPVAIEGPHLIAEALRSGIPFLSLYLREDATGLLKTLHLPRTVEPVVLSREAFSSAVATESSQGLAALIQPPQHRITIAPSHLLLVLAGLQDPGNMGTLIRSAEAFGAHAIVTTPGTVDPWNQKSIRASAGSIFRIPVLDIQLTALKQSGLQLVAGVARDGLQPDTARLHEGSAIVIGNEGSGIDASLMKLIDTCITIPMPGPVESLNAAVAGSLLLYEAARQRAFR